MCPQKSDLTSRKKIQQRHKKTKTERKAEGKRVLNKVKTKAQDQKEAEADENFKKRSLFHHGDSDQDGEYFGEEAETTYLGSDSARGGGGGANNGVLWSPLDNGDGDVCSCQLNNKPWTCCLRTEEEEDDYGDDGWS